MAFQRTPNAGSEIKPKKMDPKEKAEREEAARAYAGESPQHFVDYGRDCIDLAVKSKTDIRQMQDECWRVFNEEEPDFWGTKELWQSRITYPKPNKLVRVGQAFARQAFDVDFLSIENENDEEAADFWTKYMGLMVTRNYANFPTKFADATAMALAIGTSEELIPQWVPGKGINLVLENTENIHRDPQAESREPWSGRFWVHQAWQSYAKLKKGEDDGIYENIQDFATGSDWMAWEGLNQEEIARRKNMVHVQGKFNRNVMVSEFWGEILSPRGEILLPSAWFTFAGDQVIRKPEATPYESLPWPGVGFSALPNLRRFDGRGLIQGIRSLWYFASNLLSLHADNLNWVVNPMTEMNTDDMVNPMDTGTFPGKEILVFRTQNGQPVVRTVDRNTRNNDIIAMLSKAAMLIDDGSPVDQNMQGGPGWRQGVTKGERVINQEQSNMTMGSMATDIEDGALCTIKSMAETVTANMTYDELNQWFPKYAEKYRVPVSEEFPTGLNLPKLTSGNFKIAGISAIVRRQENLQNLEKMEEMFANPVLQPFLKPYPYLKARVKYTNLVDIGMLISEEQANQIDQAQQQQQEAGIQAQQQKQAAEAQLAGAQAHEVGAEGDRHIAQAGAFNATAAATVAGAPGDGGAPIPEPAQQPPGYGGEV